VAVEGDIQIRHFDEQQGIDPSRTLSSNPGKNPVAGRLEGTLNGPIPHELGIAGRCQVRNSNNQPFQRLRRLGPGKF
jgi:hypothetical protein